MHPIPPSLQQRCPHWRHVIKQAEAPQVLCAWDSWDAPIFKPSNELSAIGEKKVRTGGVGALILAGGQGSRLGWNGPKGCYPVLVDPEKTLFQCALEKIAQQQEAWGVPLYVVIATSPHNHAATQDFLEKHSFFGVDESALSFFQQGELPWILPDGEPFFLEGKTVTAPEGNGLILPSFLDSEEGRRWKNKGIDTITVIPIDNPLAAPFDTAFIGNHLSTEAEISLIAITRKDPTEKVGVIVREGKSCRVVEYSEISESEAGCLPSGKLKHTLGNSSLFVFSTSFFDRMKEEGICLPWHAAWKNIPESHGKKGWKLESFLFDWLPYAEKVSIMLRTREECFAPLKDCDGLAAVRALLTQR